MKIGTAVVAEDLQDKQWHNWREQQMLWHHLGHTLTRMSKWPATSEKIRALPSTMPKESNMEVCKQNGGSKGGSGTPAETARNNYREETLTNVEISCDEVKGSNPIGRPPADGKKIKARGKMFNIGTWNVRTLHKEGKIDNLQQEMEEMNVDIMGIGETRWTGTGKLQQDKYTFIYSGGEKHEYGVGIMMKNAIAKSLIGHWPVSNRCLLLKLNAAPFNINIVQIYAPATKVNIEVEENQFYEQLERVMKYTKSGEITIVMGDWNAKVGQGGEYPVKGNFGLGDLNERGGRLLDFCRSHKLVVANTLFEHPKRRIYTWKSPGDLYRNQIDYILVNQRFRNCIKQARTYPGADIGSDHNPVVMKLKVKLKQTKTKKQAEHLDTDMLQLEEYKTRYNVAVMNKFNALINEMGRQECESVQESEAEKEWRCLKESINSAAKEVLPKRKKQAKQKWMTDEILEKMKRRKRMKAEGKTDLYIKLDKEIGKECKSAKENWWKENCKIIEELECKHRTREMHVKIKEVSGHRRKQYISGCIENKEGKLLFDKEEIKERWTQYITELYDDERGAQPEIKMNEGEEDDITLEEIKEAIKESKAGKACGKDDISTEMIKALSALGICAIHKLYNNIYSKGVIPGDMNESVFIRLPKKPGTIKCTEHRTLSLMSHMLKILLRIILKRIRAKIEREINETQSGFISGKGTREGIFNLRMISEKYIEMNKDVYMCFIDYEKAFDRVNHEKMIQCMQSIGIDKSDVRIISNLYWTQKAYIRLENDISNEIQIKRGVRQGCVLSPALFNLYTEMIFRSADDLKGVNIDGININNLRYADDTVLLAESQEDLQKIVDKVNAVGKQFKMKMNAKKTKTMLFTNKQIKPKMEIKVDDANIEQVSSFVYLGHLMTEDGKNEHEIRRRIEIARSVFQKMCKTLTSQSLSIETRKRILHCYVFSTLLYGAETWTISDQMMERLRAFEMWTYRRMLKISWTTKTTNDEVLKRMNPKDRLTETIKQKKLKYFGHVCRHDTLQNRLLNGRTTGKRRRGRPRKKYVDNIKTWTGMGVPELTGTARSRRTWRHVASNPQDEEGT